MLLIETFLKQTESKGLGLFSGVRIEEGETVWKHSDILDRKISIDEFNSFPEVTKKYILEYAYFDGYSYNLDGDFTKHINHSFKKANIKFIGSGYGIATRDIEVGEELLTNYSDFDKHFSEGDYGFTLIEE